MNPIASSSWAAVVAALRRYGWLPIGVFLAHEFCAHVIDGYARWPAIDIPLHFLGGFAIAYFANGLLQLLAARGLVRPPDPVLRLLLLFAVACTAAVFWEFAEWTADHYLGTNSQMNDLDDTLLDLFMGMLGGLAFILPPLPAALRDYFQPRPEHRP
jgi:hypothetical protein